MGLFKIATKTLIVVILISGCTAQHYLRKAKRNYDKALELDPEAVMYDTFITEVPVIFPEVYRDTTFVSKPGDTVVVKKDRLTVRYVKLPGDTVWLSGECAADTVYKTIEVPVPVAIVRESYRDMVKRLFGINNLVFYAIHIGLILLVVGYIIKRIVG